MASRAEKAVPVTAFKAKCLDYIAQVSRGKVSRVVLTRRGKPVARLEAITSELPTIFGAMRGTVEVAPGVDLTAPTGGDWGSGWDGEK